MQPKERLQKDELFILIGKKNYRTPAAFSPKILQHTQWEGNSTFVTNESLINREENVNKCKV